jgi:hypothetical protein
MNDKQDPNLSSPQEANTTKHINFAEAEDTDNNSSAPASHDDDSPAKKEWQELRKAQEKDE